MPKSYKKYKIIHDRFITKPKQYVLIENNPLIGLPKVIFFLTSADIKL